MWNNSASCGQRTANCRLTDCLSQRGQSTSPLKTIEMQVCSRRSLYPILYGTLRRCSEELRLTFGKAGPTHRGHGSAFLSHHAGGLIIENLGCQFRAPRKRTSATASISVSTHICRGLWKLKSNRRCILFTHTEATLHALNAPNQEGLFMTYACPAISSGCFRFGSRRRR